MSWRLACHVARHEPRDAFTRWWSSLNPDVRNGIFHHFQHVTQTARHNFFSEGFERMYHFLGTCQYWDEPGIRQTRNDRPWLSRELFATEEFFHDGRDHRVEARAQRYGPDYKPVLRFSAFWLGFNTWIPYVENKHAPLLVQARGAELALAARDAGADPSDTTYGYGPTIHREQAIQPFSVPPLTYDQAAARLAQAEDFWGLYEYRNELMLAVAHNPRRQEELDAVDAAIRADLDAPSPWADVTPTSCDITT